MKSTTFRWCLSGFFAFQVSCLTGCFHSIEARPPVQHLYVAQPAPPPSDEIVVVTPGEYIIADGMELRTAPAWRLTKPLNTTLPGTFGVPFHIGVDPCVLSPMYLSPQGVAYVAPRGVAGAAYEGKSVFGVNDQIGIRVPASGHPIYLFCDNGGFNGVPPGMAVWSRQIRPDELALFEQTTTTQPFWKPWGRGLTYAGVAGGQLKVTFEELKNENGTLIKTSEKDYTFDLNADGPTEISVWGCRVRVLSATATEIRFQVLKGFKD